MKKSFVLMLATVAALGFACGTMADEPAVTTNVWIAADGGNAVAGENWQDGQAPVSTNVADFTALASGKEVKIVKVDKPDEGDTLRAAGLLFSGAADDVWTLKMGTLGCYTQPLGYMPFCVLGGTLTFDSTAFLDGSKIVRKTGDGTLKLMSFLRAEQTDGILEVAEGAAMADYFSALWTTHVKVIDDGQFHLKEGESNTYIGSFASGNGTTLDLMGQSLSLGGSGSARLSDAVVGTGRVQSVAGSSLMVTNVSTNITYVAREGNLRFDTADDNAESVLGFWTFDDASNPGYDSGIYGNHLFASNGVEIVEDAERGKVAKFTANKQTALYGQGASGGIDGLPSGKHPYTFSYWFKVAPNTANTQGGLFFWGPIPVVADQIMINRLDAKGQVYFGHNGTAGIWPEFPEIKQSRWFHFAVTFDGTSATIYTNGVPFRSANYAATNLKAENFSIGRPWSASAQWLDGWMDDAVMFNRVLSAEEIRRDLYERTAVATPRVTTLPLGTQLETTYNGEIYLAGTQTISTVGGNAIRGGVRMLTPGTLQLSGDVPGGDAQYTADIAGPVDLVKVGAETNLKLTGPLSYTGTTRVKEGTLTLAREGVTRLAPYARYDFESDAVGKDSSGNGRTLANSTGVTRERDDTRGWVARFSAASHQELSATVAAAELGGNCDYTLSVWAKASSFCPEAGSFLSLGTNGQSFQQVQFRFQNFAQRRLVLAHWGGDLDFSGIAGPSTPTEWHHYVAVHKGATFVVYCDGSAIATYPNTSKPLNIQSQIELHIGSHFNANDLRFFDGWIDDVRIYAYGFDADNVQRLYAGQDVYVDHPTENPLEHLPKPVLHYAFEDAANLGKDSSANGCDLAAGGAGTLAQCDSILPGKALAFDTGRLSYLSREIPSVVPQGGKAFTMTLWVQTTEKDVVNEGQYPTFVSWGEPNQSKIGYMLSYYYNTPWHLRCYLSGASAQDIDSAYSILGLRTASEAGRWHHYATVYNPSVGILNYIDGHLNEGFSKKGAHTSGSGATHFYLGLKPTCLTCRFSGKLDEVKVYDVALTESQIRLAMRGEMEPDTTRVLPMASPVTVDAGATLAVVGGEQRVASVAGAGTVTLDAGALLGADDWSAFTGSVTGGGFIDYAGAETLTSTAQVSANMFVRDLKLMLSEAGRGATVETTGQIVVAETGTIRITDATSAYALGGRTWSLAKGATVAVPSDLSGWTVEPEPVEGWTLTAADGVLRFHVRGGGTMIIVR